jgi:hypothetical protein
MVITTQLTDAADILLPLPPSGIQFLQQVIATLLYYARAVNNIAIGTISTTQSQGTKATPKQVKHLLNYCATHPDAIICCHASDMALHVHSNTSYLSVSKGRSRIGGYFF